MKIRTGFVSNSSSSSFIIDKIPAKLTSSIKDENDILLLLKKGEEVGAEQISFDAFYAVCDLLEKNNLVIMCVGGGPDDGKIIPFKDERKKKI